MTILMSFWPNIYNKIIDQKKLIEYRRNFPKDCTYAYMYISKPVKSICGIIYFGKRHSLASWKKEYENNLEILNRISFYMQSYRYGVEITGFQKIKPITLTELRENVPNFVAPQSYFLLKNNAELNNYLIANTVKIENKVINSLENIFPEHICKEY